MAYALGEFSSTAIIQEFTDGGAGVTKGDVVTITPAAASTVATVTNSDASGNGPYAVAIETAVASAKVRCVIYGEVGVDASGNGYQGALVYGKGGSAVTRTLSSYDPETAAPALGRVTEGAADGGVCTVWVGIGGI